MSVSKAADAKRLKKKDAAIEEVLTALVEPETAGDPMTEKKWLRSSLRSLSQHLKAKGHPACANTVRRLLKKQQYSLKANRKVLTGLPHPDRDAQFRYIESQRQAFLAQGLPVISVDTKKKELIGAFKNAGRSWCRQAEEVNVHDFRNDALARAVPYGIYDVKHNRGSVFVGRSADTPQFAVDAIASWWKQEGKMRFPDAARILILADAGGSNGYRPRAWKEQLQARLADEIGLEVTVCHYPSGASKWNPVEHRLFGPISINWSGKPLRSLETMLGYIRGTATETGLKVKGYLIEGIYKKGIKVSEAQKRQWNLIRHETCPNWNYTIKPRTVAFAPL